MLLRNESQRDNRVSHWYCGLLVAGLIAAVGTSLTMLRSAVAEESRRALVEKAELAQAKAGSQDDKICEAECEAVTATDLPTTRGDRNARSPRSPGAPRSRPGRSHRLR